MRGKTKINVTIITGFLGAGKTTYINQVLKSHPDIQFALVENEFGEISVDSKLIKGVNASQMFELKQGCICCTISDEYETVLAELAERFPQVEHLLIETTGIADPAPVIRPFFQDEKLKELYQFNGTVCIVDCQNFANQRNEEVTVKQIAVADLILISKVEELTVSVLESLRSKIRQLNPISIITENPNNVNPIANIYRQKFFPELPRGKLLHSGIESKALSFTIPLNKEKFTHWLSYNLDIYKSQIYRVKGILCFENELYEYILQGVEGTFEITESEKLLENFNSQIILIGKGIPDIQY